MEDIFVNLIVIAALTVSGLVIFLLIRKRQRTVQQALEKLALERGWSLETLREPQLWGLRLTAPGWTLESVSRSSSREAAPGSSNVSMSTLWQADCPGSTVLLGPRSPGVGLSDAVVRQFILGVTGDDLAEVALDHPLLRPKYMLRAQDPFAAESFQTPPLESALLEWKKVPPFIMRDRSGLRIELNGLRLKTPEDILAFLRIAEALLAACR